MERPVQKKIVKIILNKDIYSDVNTLQHLVRIAWILVYLAKLMGQMKL